MAYTGGFITGCDSPALGNSKSTYIAKWDAHAEAVDKHDHSSGKGKPISTLGIGDSAITNPKLAAGAVTGDKITDATIGVAKLSALTPVLSANFSWTSSGTDTVFHDSAHAETVTGASAAITTHGRPVLLELVDTSFGDSGYVGVSGSNTAAEGGTLTGIVYVFRDGTLISTRFFTVGSGTLDTPTQLLLSAGLTCFDLTPAAGAHTYSLKAEAITSGNTITLTGRLRVVEL